MKRYSMLETKWGKALFCLFLFAMLLLARDTLITTCLLGFTKSQLLGAGLVGVCVFCFLLRHRKEAGALLTDGRTILALLSVLIIVVPMVCKGDWQLMYFSIAFCLVTAVFFTFFTTWQQVAKYYVLILAALGAYSLVGMYVLKPLAMAGKILPSVLTNSAGMEFYNFGLTFVVPWQLWHRNFGIFREPGVYQFFLILGIYLTHYGVQWKRRRAMWAVTALLCGTLLSTFAIGGFIELGLLAVFIYFDKRYYRTGPGRLVGAAAVAAVAAVVVHILIQLNKPYFELTIYYEFYDMFRRLTTDSDSLVDRLSAIFVSVEMFLKNPVFGDRIANVLHGTAHNTSSTLILYAIFGVVGGTVNVAAWAALLWKKERCLVGNLLLMVILFMSFNTQNLTADLFFWLFPYMALTQVLAPKLTLPERKA